MSVWEDAFDDALLEEPWQSLPTSPSTLVKYAPHPSRPGYILLLTDLSGLYVESLLAPSIPGRLNEIKRTFQRRKRAASDEEEDVVKQSEAALARLGECFGNAEELGECEVELRDHDYHDKVLCLHADGWDWLFNLTELKGREPLQIISRQLISPLAEALGGALEVDVPKGTKKKPPSPIDIVGAVLSAERVRDVLYPQVGSSSTSKRKGGVAKKQKAPAKQEPAEEEDAEPDDEVAGEGHGEEEGEGEGEEEEEGYHSSPEPTPPPSTKKATPKSAGKQKAAKEEEDEDGDFQPPTASASASALASASPAPPPRRHTKRAPPSSNSASSAPPSGSASPVKKGKGKGKGTGKGKGKNDEDGESPAPPTQSSQKTKRQREQEEEEELNKKLQEMKRKMGSGGGGRLGKRRMAR